MSEIMIEGKGEFCGGQYLLRVQRRGFPNRYNISSDYPRPIRPRL